MEFISFPDHDPGGKVRILVPPEVTSEAVYSICQQYRYILHRQWEPAEPKRTIMFLMMNPSTATEDYDDPTVRKCRTYAIKWGYNDMFIGNIMAYRATQPIILRDVDDPVGPENLHFLRCALELRPKLICAWGRIPPRFAYAENAVLELIKELGVEPFALRLTLTGGPYHPLYLPYDIQPIPMPLNR